MQFVAVIGGFFALEGEEAAAAHKIAESFGAALAKAGLGLVVYFSNPQSAEPHFVKGYVGAGADQPKSIRVRHVRSQLKLVHFAEQDTHEHLFDPMVFPGEDWEAPFYRSLAEEDGVDGVILLCGGSSTLIAGHIAVARGLPVLAVPDCGGSARKLCELIHPNGWQSGSDAALVAKLEKQIDAALKAKSDAKRRERQYALLVSKGTTTALCLLMFAGLVASFGYGVLQGTVPRWFGLISLSALMCAGATGALARKALWDSERDAFMLLLLGALAGFVVGLAYLVPQLITSQQLFDPAKQAVVNTDRIAVASALLLAISAGVGFDTVFRRLRKDADSAPIRPADV